MKKGKRTCEVLKDVRRCVARENHIPLTEHECTFEGECRGTCPYCEAEVRYLEQELQRRLNLGKAVTVAGIAVSSIMMSGCHNPRQSAPEEFPAPPATEETTAQQNTDETESQDIPAPGQSDTYEIDGYEGVVLSGLIETEADKSCKNDTTSKASDAITKTSSFESYTFGEIEIDDIPNTNNEPTPNISGTPAQYLKARLTAFPSSLREPKYSNAYLVLIIDEKGVVKEVVFQPRETSPSPEVQQFYEESTRILKAMPKWTGANGAASYEIPIRDLW